VRGAGVAVRGPGYRSGMLRDGPLPRFAHGIIEYLAAITFIVVPLLLFPPEAGAATAASIIVGVVLLVVAASTEGPTSLVNQIPVAVHVAFDYILAAFLIAAPFLFGFSEVTPALAFFLALGIAHLLITIATRFLPKDAEGRRGRRARAEGARRAEAPPSAPAEGPDAGPGARRAPAGDR
jgi:hypothetical protein